MEQGLFGVLTAVVAVVAGGVAAVAGFGIGSLLTPLFALRLGLKLAVACVAVPHFLGTLLRFGLMRRDINGQVLLTFGLASAAGGLAGALLQAHFSSRLLTVLFGSLLVLAGLGELAGQRLRIRQRPLAIGAGILSGAFGGLVGNQGGIRSAALLNFDLSRQAFVATATAVGLFVDGARLPVYLATRGRDDGHAGRRPAASAAARTRLPSHRRLHHHRPGHRPDLRHQRTLRARLGLMPEKSKALHLTAS